MRRRTAAGVFAALAVIAACAVSAAHPASAAAPLTGYVGYGTIFPGPGQPYGGCGVPAAERGTTNTVALNAFDTQGDGTAYPLPLPPNQLDKLGDFANGRNCGRWVRVTIGDYCRGVNDGNLHQPFCRGTLVADRYNGATLTMLVADSCTDPNAWCRNSKHHLDLYQGSLNRFTKGGHVVGDLSAHWNNRKISWSFVPAPHYSGDIRIGFTANAKRAYPAIAIAHLRDGIHGVEYLAGGRWQHAKRNGALGQAFTIGPTSAGGGHYVIRVRDAADAVINGGRTYHFDLPSACATGCRHSFTAVPYTT